MKKSLPQLLFGLFAILDGAASADGTGDAHALFESGTAHYASREYEQALLDYLAAYKLAPLPLLLFDIAKTYEALEKSGPAVDYYQRFLSTGEASDAEALIARAQIQSLVSAAMATQPAPAAHAPVAVYSAAQVPQGPAKTTTPQVSRRSAWPPTGGISLAASGAALMVAGATCIVVSLSRIDSVRQTFGGPYDAGIGERYYEARTIGQIGLGVAVTGSVSLVAGSGWLLGWRFTR